MSSSPNNNIFNQVSAATTWSKVQLKVNNGSVTCTWWLWVLNMWTVNAWFSTGTVSWTYVAPTTTNWWSCTDLDWSRTRTFAIRITWDLYDSASHTISSWSAAICLMAAAPTKLQGTNAASLSTTIPTCTSTTWMVVAQELMKRSTTAWEIYQYWVQPRILVTIPASQAAGTYTWVLEITIPCLYTHLTLPTTPYV